MPRTSVINFPYNGGLSIVFNAELIPRRRASRTWPQLVGRLDLENEGRNNQGGAAAFKAYVQQIMELLPHHSTPFGRGKVWEHEDDPIQYLYPAFLPVRGPDFKTLPRSEQEPIKWREYVENERDEYDGRLDFSGQDMITYHNKIILAFWLGRRLLVPNVHQQRTAYEHPPRSGYIVYGTTHQYIGCR